MRQRCLISRVQTAKLTENTDKKIHSPRRIILTILLRLFQSPERVDTKRPPDSFKCCALITAAPSLLIWTHTKIKPEQ